MMTRASTSFFDAYPPGPRDVVFLGDSITAAGQWNEIFPNYSVRNRGIGGDRTDDLLKRLHQVTASPVDKLFIKIATNDLGTGVGQETILAKLRNSTRPAVGRDAHDVGLRPEPSPSRSGVS